MRLDQLPIGQPARVEGVDARGGALLRLMEMGLVRGARVELRKRAPWGGPLELRVEGYLLTLRRADALAFQVEPVTPPVTAPVARTPVTRTSTAEALASQPAA